MLQTHTGVDIKYVVEKSLLHHHISGNLVFILLESVVAHAGVGLGRVPRAASPVHEIDSRRYVARFPGMYGLKGRDTHIVVMGVEEIVGRLLSYAPAVVDRMRPPAYIGLHAAVGHAIIVMDIHRGGAAEYIGPHALKRLLKSARIVGLGLCHGDIGAHLPVAV